MAEGYTITTLSPMRKIIAARMTEAKRTIPHFRLTVEIEVDAMMGLRKELLARNPNANVSLNDLLIKACATALMNKPAVNIQWVEGEIHQYHTADISVVIAVEGGLSTPIIRSAESKTIWEISREVKQLASRASNNTLKMNEILGGSFSVSNLGMYGVDQFDAIVNPPQCAILSIGRAKPSMVVSESGEARIATVLRATLSVDHRAIDGTTGAKFLKTLRQVAEQPRDWL